MFASPPPSNTFHPHLGIAAIVKVYLLKLVDSCSLVAPMMGSNLLNHLFLFSEHHMQAFLGENHLARGLPCEVIPNDNWISVVQTPLLNKNLTSAVSFIKFFLITRLLLCQTTVQLPLFLVTLGESGEALVQFFLSLWMNIWFLHSMLFWCLMRICSLNSSKISIGVYWILQNSALLENAIWVSKHFWRVQATQLATANDKNDLWWCTILCMGDVFGFKLRVYGVEYLLRKIKF